MDPTELIPIVQERIYVERQLCKLADLPKAGKIELIERLDHVRSREAAWLAAWDEAGTGKGQRRELRCEYGIDTPSTEQGIEGCGQPAVAVWEWKGWGSVFVCEEHDRLVAQQQQNGIPNA